MKKPIAVGIIFLIAGILIYAGIAYACVLVEKKEGINSLKKLFASLGKLAENNMEGKIGDEDGVSIKINDPVSYDFTLISGKKGRIIIAIDADIFEGSKMSAKGSYEAEGLAK